MSTPALFVVAGPNGAGKSTFVERVLAPATGLGFINADEIAAELWPGEESAHAYEASRAAAAARAEAFAQRRSFITETVFSHESKVQMLEEAARAGYHIDLHVMLLPEDVTVARVSYRVTAGGHSVPEQKIRERYQRVWALVVRARRLAHRTVIYDNSTSRPFRRIAAYERGQQIGTPVWPSWTPEVLRD